MGSKAKNLQLLLEAGFNVPPFVILPSDGVTDQLISDLIGEQLGRVDLFAVRSSAEVEDGSEKSYAGHFYSAVAVKKQNLYKEYCNVVNSFNGLAGSVVVQQFIPSDSAGVLFTNDGNGLMVINSNLGLCKTVVDGGACDEWYISRDSKVMRKHIAKNKRPLLCAEDKIIEGESSGESISQQQINMLVEEGKRIEKFFGTPQDIEWCFHGNKLFILQSRPITRSTDQSQWIFYDSANIAESYSGVVLPLTHSFAVSIYKKVYENLLLASGASPKRIARNQHIFNNMVSNFYGRMYYNMNSWYLMMSFMPGYRRNKENLERMLTMNVRVDVPRSVLPSIWLKISYPLIVIVKLILFNGTIRRFNKRVKETLSRYRNEKIEDYSAKQCLELYDLLNRELLEYFHIPVENDFLMMTYLGILRKKYSEEQLKQLIAFDNVSSQQVESITRLSQAVFKHYPLADAVEANEYGIFKRLLLDYPDVNKQFNDYFEAYGGRFANELKLESADVEFESDALFNLLKVYRNRNASTTNDVVRREIKGFALKRFVKYARQREELRLLRSNSFALVRRIFRRIGGVLSEQGVIEKQFDIFYLTVDEVKSAVDNIGSTDFKQHVLSIRIEYDGYRDITPPAFFTVKEGQKPMLESLEVSSNGTLIGRSCTSGTVRGKVRVFEEFSLPNPIDFDIMVARNTDPGWAALIGLSKGIIVENGGILSHAAIVSRELGIPTVIGVANVTRILKTGQVVEINGSTGEVRVIGCSSTSSQ